MIGLDLGSRTIGVAVSDELALTAQPLVVLKRRGTKKDIQAIAQLAQEYEAETIVIGLPRKMNGALGPQAEKTQTFGRVLAAAVDLKVVYWDERWTTVSAERVLIEADLSRAKRKQVIDKLAASLILQGYLDRRRARGAEE